MNPLALEIANAHKELRLREVELQAARSQARVCKKRIAIARAKLDTLLDELATGRSCLPLFDRPEPAPQKDEATPAKAPGVARKSKGDGQP